MKKVSILIALIVAFAMPLILLARLLQKIKSCQKQM